MSSSGGGGGNDDYLKWGLLGGGLLGSQWLGANSDKGMVNDVMNQQNQFNTQYRQDNLKAWRDNAFPDSDLVQSKMFSGTADINARNRLGRENLDSNLAARGITGGGQYNQPQYDLEMDRQNQISQLTSDLTQFSMTPYSPPPVMGLPQQAQGSQGFGGRIADIAGDVTGTLGGLYAYKQMMDMANGGGEGAGGDGVDILGKGKAGIEAIKTAMGLGAGNAATVGSAFGGGGLSTTGLGAGGMSAAPHLLGGLSPAAAEVAAGTTFGSGAGGSVTYGLGAEGALSGTEFGLGVANPAADFVVPGLESAALDTGLVGAGAGVGASGLATGAAGLAGSNVAGAGAVGVGGAFGGATPAMTGAGAGAGVGTGLATAAAGGLVAGGALFIGSQIYNNLSDSGQNNLAQINMVNAALGIDNELDMQEYNTYAGKYGLTGQQLRDAYKEMYRTDKMPNSQWANGGFRKYVDGLKDMYEKRQIAKRWRNEVLPDSATPQEIEELRKKQYPFGPPEGAGGR